MPWYTIAKVYLRKVWAWCKKYWQLLVGLAVPIILGLLFRRYKNSNYTREVVAQIQEGHRQEVAAIDESHRIEGEKIRKAQRRRDEVVAEIESQAAAASIELDEKKKTEIRRLVGRYENDPTTLTHELSRTTGIAIWTGKRN